MPFKGLTSFNEICFSCFKYTVTIRFNEFKRNKLHDSSEAEAGNKLCAQVTGKRKREVGLVVPAKFSALTSELRIARILQRELTARAEKYSHFELKNITFNDDADAVLNCFIVFFLCCGNTRLRLVFPQLFSFS